MKCPKCGGEMEEGVAGGEGGDRWFDKHSMIGKLMNFDIVGKKTMVYRCKSCGYLESYAK